MTFYVYETVEDPNYYAEVLNGHGEVQIGSDILNITRSMEVHIMLDNSNIHKTA